jgi:hypothetical protein
MEFVKFHLTATILLTQAASLLDKNTALPYFPIEISRSAASSVIAGNIMKIGFVTLPATMYFTSSFSFTALLLWMGLVVVAFVPDTMSLGLHMSGVALVFGAASLQMRQGTDFILVGFGLTMYVLRIIFKAMALLARDSVLYILMAEMGFINAFILRNQSIMFGAAVATEVLPFYQLSGVLQWVCFLSLSYLFK